MQDWKLLVIEDDPDGRELVGRMLGYYHIPFEVATNAEEAWDRLSADHYTAAIVDLALPGADGWTLLNAIRNNPTTADMPCVAITAFHSAEVAFKALEAGFQAYFPKPLETNSFVRNLEQILG